MKSLFQTPLEKFLRLVWPRWRYLGGAFDLADYVSKKIRVIRHVNQIILQEIDNFLKKSFEITFWTSTKGRFCWIFQWKLFSNASKNFLWVVGPRWRYLEGVFDLADDFSKKNWTHTTLHSKYIEENVFGGQKLCLFCPPPMIKIYQSLHDLGKINLYPKIDC